MSSEAVADGAGIEAGASRPGKLKWIIIAVVALALAGAGAFLFLGKKTAAGPQSEQASKAARVAPLYYKFDPAFVVNFGGEGNSRYLQISVEVMSRMADVIEAVKANEPAIRNDLVMLYSAQQYDVLMSAQGKDNLRQASLEAIRKTLAKEGTKPEAIEGVYFTSFVIQ